MSNDLLFSVLPRNTRPTIKPDERLKKVDKSKRGEQLNEDEKEQHESVHHVDEDAQRALHKRVEERAGNRHGNDQKQSKEQSSKAQENPDEEGENSEPDARKHFDIYI